MFVETKPWFLAEIDLICFQYCESAESQVCGWWTMELAQSWVKIETFNLRFIGAVRPPMQVLYYPYLTWPLN